MKNQLKTIPMATALAVALLFCAANARAQSGTWTNLNLVTGNAGGSWTNVASWKGGGIASGTDNTADFSTLVIGTNSTVTLDGARTIGALIFADATPGAAATNWDWVVNTSSTNAAGTAPLADAITLAVSSGSPVINVSNQIATFNAPVYGAGGFIKAGGGTLRLNAANTNGTGTLNGLIIVTNGILQAGNANALGGGGSVVGGSSTNEVICTNGGTVEVISTIAVNNELLVLGGTGNGGTNGALYFNNPALLTTSTRWALSTFNSSGVSGNSSVSAPGIFLVTNTTIRVDGVAGFNGFSNAVLVGYVSSSTNTLANITNSFYTLTKTGTGRLELERGMMVSNVVVQAGSVFPDSANAFNAVQYWTVQSGGAILNDQNQTFNATTITLEVDAGGLYDVNFRGNGTPGNDNNVYTQTLGTLTGAGTITCGERGEIAAQTLNINGTNYSSFSGLITDTNGDALNLGKNGAGSMLRLSGTNSYHGLTTVSGGTLLVDGTAINGSNYIVNTGAILGGTGSISAPITLNSGTLLAGDGGGTLTVSTVASGGGDTTIVSNASLNVSGTLGNSGGYLNILYLTNGTLQLPLLGSGASAFISTLNNDGNVTLSYTTPNPSVGQFPLIAYSNLGGLAGGGTNGITLVPPAGTTAYLSNNVANSSLDVVVTGIPALVWVGTPTGNWSIGSSPADWLNGVTPSGYTESGGAGPFVIFNDTATGTTAVNLTTTVSPKGITVNNTLLNYTNNGTGAIGGTGGLLKQGTGVLVIANSGSNYFSGTLAIQAGEVRIGNGGTAGNLGTGPVNNGGQLTFNRSDNITVPNAISGAGALVKSTAGSATLTGLTNYGGTVSINGGTLALATGGTITLSNNIAGTGIFGVTGSGSVVLEGTANIWSGGTVITNGTLQVGDNNSAGSLPGNVTDNGTLAFGSSITANNNISGAGGVVLPNSVAVTLGGVNTYAGPTVVLGGSVTAAGSSYPAGSILILGDQTGGSGAIGTAYFTAGNAVIGGLNAGGNTSADNAVNLTAGGQTLTINGNVSVGATTPVGASAFLQPTGTGASVVINTNGGTIQLGLGDTSSGVNPDNVQMDLSQIDNFTVNLGTTGLVNLGTLDGNPGPPAGATVVNYLLLAQVSNSITAGSIVIGAGGRQLVPQLQLGPGTNLLNVNNLNLGTGGRDGGYLLFNPSYTGGGVRVRNTDGVSPANMNVGVNTTSGTSGAVVNTVDLTGGYADLLLNTLVIGDYPVRVGENQNTFTFNNGILVASSTSLSSGANGSNPGSSTLNIAGGIASLGLVSLTASPNAGTLNITGGTVTVSNITYSSTGAATLTLDGCTLNVNPTNHGNPVTAPVAAGVFNANDTVNLGVNGNQLTVGQFPLISYTGSIGESGYGSLNLTSLPAGVGGYLSNNVANSSVDVVITNAPVYVNLNPTNLIAKVSGGTLTLSWPGDHLGWRLLAQTNSLNTGLNPNTNAWFAIAGSASVTNEVITINPANGTVFYRMVYP
jgi:fibronectin-binding autotransporter adhesin